jgi:hypothetical protein
MPWDTAGPITNNPQPFHHSRQTKITFCGHFSTLACGGSHAKVPRYGLVWFSDKAMPKNSNLAKMKDRFQVVNGFRDMAFHDYSGWVVFGFWTFESLTCRN